MRRVAVVACLVAAWAAIGQDRNRQTLGRNGSAFDGAALRFAPASGAGLPSSGDLCDSFSGLVTGSNGFCFKGDGTSYSGGLSFTSVGSPTTQTIATCSNGTDCSNTTGQRFDGSSSAYKSSTTPASPTGDFSICGLFSVDTLAARVIWAGKDDGGHTGRGMEFSIETNGAMQFIVYSASSSSTVTAAASAIVAKAEHFVCATYDFVADGSSVGKIYVDGAQTGSSNSAMVGPMNSNTEPWHVGVRDETYFPGWTPGRFRQFLVTEQVLSSAQIASMARTALADTPTGSKGETLTFTRGSSKFCTNGAGSAGTTLPSNRPCISNGGLHVEEGRTNSILHSEEIDDASWTPNGGGSGGSPTVTANSASVLAPDGSPTAEKIDFPATNAGGAASSFIYQGFTGTVASWTGSVYFRTATGTASFYVYLWDGAGGVTTAACSASTTWTRCTVNKTLTVATWYLVWGVDNTLASMTSQPAFTVYAWGAQAEEGAPATSYIATAGTAVTRSAEIAYLPAQAVMTNPYSVSGRFIVGNASAAYFWDQRNGSGYGSTLLVAGNQTQVYMTDGVDFDAFTSHSGLTWNAGTFYKLAVSKSGGGSSSVSTYRDGALVTVDYSGTSLTTNINTGVMRIGVSFADAQQLNGWLKDFCVSGSTTGCAP